MPTYRSPIDPDSLNPYPSSYYESHAIKMSRPQDIYFDYNARQQHLRERARASSRRPRNRWPPLPYAEEELVSLSHELRPDPPDAGGKLARSRGSLDQQPIILEVNPPASEHHPQRWRETASHDRNGSPSNNDTSSDETSGPETPTDPGSGDEKRNRDRRYVFIPQEGVEIPLTYDEPRTPILAKHSESQARVRSDRGRGNIPKLDTDISRAKSSHDVPVRLERERSPYRSTPRTKETRFSGEYLLSPEAMSPRMRHPESQSGPVGPPKRASSITPENMARHQDHGPARAPRPSMVRHASAMAYSRETATPTRSSTHHGSKEPLYDAVAPARCSSSRLDAVLPDPRPRSSAFLQGLSSEHPTREGYVPPSQVTSTPTDGASMRSVPLPSAIAQHSLNAMLSSPSSDRRRASPRNSPRSSPIASPSSSPLSSPPRTPPAEAGNRRTSYMESVRTSASNSRPSSPLHPLHPSKPTNHLTTRGDVSNNPRPAIRSRQTSPLPSAMNGHLEPEPTPRIDVRSPSPARHRRSSTYGGADQRSRSRNPTDRQNETFPDTPATTLRPGSLEHRRRSSSALDTRPRLSIDPSRTQELPSASQARHLSLVSPTATRAASVGTPPAALPPCPRSIPVGGHNDWYSLHGFPSFKICPTCREAICNAGYGRHLVAAFSKSPERPVRCAFSIPWVRMAYLLMVKKRRSDMSLLYDMADVAEDAAPCPGKRAAAREWYRIHDIDSDRKVPGFYACPYCIQSLEAIFPTLEGIFQKSRSHHSVEERTCSLRSESSRFATYVDLLEDTANQAKEYRRAPNTYRFVELAKKMEATPPCSRDDMLRGKSWHVIPKLPEFTACSDCYEDVVWPAVLQGLPLAKQFSRYPQTIEKAQVGVSCQMYSSRMRKVFLEACSDDDFDYLSRVSLKRYRIEKELQRRIIEAQRLPRAQREMAMEDIVDEWQDWD
ncbi:MAG: hypothetical protein Q9193_002437 [Seirophora villosa]